MLTTVAMAAGDGVLDELDERGMLAAGELVQQVPHKALAFDVWLRFIGGSVAASVWRGRSILFPAECRACGCPTRIGADISTGDLRYGTILTKLKSFGSSLGQAQFFPEKPELGYAQMTASKPLIWCNRLGNNVLRKLCASVPSI